MRLHGVSALALLLGAGCGAAPSESAAPTAATPVELVTVAEPQPVAAPVRAPPRCDALDMQACVFGTKAPGAQLDARVDAAHAVMLEGKFRDAGAIAELARLQLWRDAPQAAHDDGQADAGRAMMNARRALAVDDDRAEVRLVTAMALARSLLGSGEASSTSHRLRLHLVEMQARRAQRPGAPAFVAAAAGALLGYLALDMGNAETARAAFEEATQIVPELVTAWVGLGDAARAASDFDAATRAYQRAMSLAPDEAWLRAAVAASERKESLRVGSSTSSPVLDALSDDALAPQSTSPASCSAAVRAHAANQELCDGVDALATAKTEIEHDEAAMKILSGFQALRPLCEARDPACGSHVAPAVFAAAHAFDRAGHVAKSITTFQLVMRRADDLPDTRTLLPAVALEVADRYYALAIYDQAARFYEQHAQLARRSDVTPRVSARARALRAALGDAKAIEALEEGGLAGSRDEACSRTVCAVRRLASEKAWP